MVMTLGSVTRLSHCLLTIAATDDGHLQYSTWCIIMCQEVVRATYMELKDPCFILGMDLTTLISASFLLYFSWRFYLLRGRNMPRICSLWSLPCIFGWLLCHCRLIKKKGNSHFFFHSVPYKSSDLSTVLVRKLLPYKVNHLNHA